MKIKPSKKTKCFFILDIGMNAYLSDEDPSDNMDSSDIDHLYKEITEGVFYPCGNGDYLNGKKIIGFFYDVKENEYLTFYNDEFFTDAEWKPISEELVEFMTQHDINNAVDT
ncbi:hypothetical protein ACTWQB_17055 [Piscibacillus sp. B03]|uniref:hypothetical protein n=1 Tax=Piscibacillus sp. B03 TaxID=3457430 RepID=UPI003FCCE23D